MKTSTVIISVEGLNEEAIPKLRDALSAMPGVAKVDFSLERQVATVECDLKQSNIDALLRAVLKAGYKVL